MKKAAGGASRKLAPYRAKRHFNKTPEPSGSQRAAPAGQGALQFVVQKHDATRLHYDFRLEHDGVLKSWAVPKEPSLSTKDKRLAVQTEDHPLDYGGFEGEIPEGEYGAGSVVIWDRGHWQPLNDADEGLKEGKLDFELDGERLKGRFTLVRMADRPSSGTSKGRGKRKSDKHNWLLLKRTDRPEAERKTATPRPSSGTPKGRLPSGTSKGRPPSGTSKVRVRRKQSAPDPEGVPAARRAALPKTPSPQLTTPVTRPPDGPGWLFEPKLDGYRVLCRIDDGDVTVLTRRGNDWTSEFTAIAAAAKKLPCRTAILDGEAVVFDSHGVTSFQRLQNALKGDSSQIELVAFDLVHLDGFDLTRVPLLERKRLLEQLLEGAPAAIRFGEHVTENGAKFFAAACKLGLEGIIAKREADPYRQERTRSWLKIKCLKREEFVVVGFTDPGGSRTAFGALLVATRSDAAAPLRYAGKVGTGFDERTLRALHARLRPLERRLPPVERASARGVARGVHWVEPELVAEIAYTEWTSDGRLRHPIYVGLREDKTAAEVVEERAEAPVERTESAPAATPAAGPKAQVRLTHPDKILFPDPGITKRQLADYWREVADVALPLLRGRPLTLRRCPEGYAGQCFWQKHVGVGVPAAVPRVAITEGEDPYAAIDDVASLQALVQIGVLEMHVWGSRAEHLDQPDIIVLDLDPAEDVPWHEVVRAGFDVKGRVEALGLNAFARVTGGKGLHVVVPVTPGPTWPAVKKFTHAFVNEMVRAEPRRFIASMSKTKRVGKIFIDYLRNDAEATAIGSYSPRARAGAPVALPIEWDELDAKAAQAPRYGLLEVPALVRRRKRDPWEGFEAARRALVD
ncbi:MAG TPA: DNA ligase D [Gammaproteobacteria bacterium]|nr:DNA ligase D [Gammaproteobacteria bacterium]